MKSILFFISISIFISSNFAQNGTCNSPSTIVQNEANSPVPSSSFTQCVNSPIESGGKIIIYSTVVSSPDGTLGLVQEIGTNTVCNESTLLSSRIAELFIANDCPGTPITPSETIAHTYNSSTFNPEWTGLLPSTNYTVKITINVPNTCIGLINKVCLNQYFPQKYKCQTVDFSLSSPTTSFQCTDPKVNLLANDPPTKTIADKWIYPGFIIRVWSLPGSSWSFNQKLTFIDNGSVAMNEFYVGTNPMLWGIDHVQPGSYAFGITNIGTKEFGYEIVNGADGKVVESGIFNSGKTVSGAYSPVGTSNYTITRVGAGPVATGVSNDPNSGGDGFFDPSISGEGTFDITYTWNNGAGCLGAITKQVVVTCPTSPSIICGTCATPTCPIYNAPNGTASSSTYPTTYEYDPSSTNLVGPLSFTNYYPITTTQVGTLGIKQGFGPSISSSCITRTYSLKATCASADLNPSRLNANQVGSGFNPEWDNLPAGTYILAITTNLSDATCEFDYSIAGWYMIPPCTAKTGTFNITGATLNNSAYDITAGSTITITNNSDAVMPTGTHELSYAFFSCKPTLPLTASQLLDLRTVPCYLGSDNGVSTNDKNNSGFSQTFSTLNKVYILPYTRFPAPALGSEVIVNNGTGCYAIGNILELNYLPTCPTENTFIKLDWAASNSPFIPFVPTTFNCNDGLQQIWKNVEPSINTNGRIQTSPGFNLNLSGLSVTKSSVLVSINGIPYSYYGPTGTAPAGVLDWGPMSPLGSGGTFDIIEPFIKGGSSVTLQICDARTSIQNIPYTVYDHATGAKTTGSVSVSNGTCQTVTFTVTSPTITWNIDGIASKIINNTDGSGTFDPSSLSAGQHIINYSYNNNGCTLLATQTITINPLVTPTSTNTTICSGTTSTLTASGTTTYNWYDASAGGNNVGSSSTFTTPILTSSTSYWVSSGSGLCESARFKVDVTVKPNVTPTFTLTNNFCINTQAQTLPTTSNNAIIGTWVPATINTSSAGTKTYQFTPNINQCASVVSETINVLEKPVANATPSTLSGKAVLDVNFTNLSTNATNLNWDFGNGETSTTIGNTSSSYTNVGNYSVTLIASNGVCPDNIWTTIITVLPIDPLTFNIPNIFTPNNDGVNDNYFIELENAASFEATIFNRWGNEMISQNKINEKWDGKSASGKMSDDGVYFIKYKIVGLDKSIKEGVASFQLQN